jgi:hypothetical protein
VDGQISEWREEAKESRRGIDFWLREYETWHAIGYQFKMLVITADAVPMLL